MSDVQLRDLEPKIREAKGRVFVLLLLWGIKESGLEPVSTLQLHSAAFLANVLSPVYGVLPLDGKVLKREGGPFYPEIQRAVDRFVGMGILDIQDLEYVHWEDQGWQIKAKYRLITDVALLVLETLRSFPDGYGHMSYFKELALALGALSDDEIQKSSQQDATYSDPQTDYGRVLDFAEWKQHNPSGEAANALREELFQFGTRSAAEGMHLYIRHLQERLTYV